jgi:hypothetical protein
MPPWDAPILAGDDPLSGNAGMNAEARAIVKWQRVWAMFHNLGCGMLPTHVAHRRVVLIFWHSAHVLKSRKNLLASTFTGRSGPDRLQNEMNLSKRGFNHAEKRRTAIVEVSVLCRSIVGPRCLADRTTPARRGLPATPENRRCPGQVAAKSLLFARRAGVHVDFHADRHFNDLRCLPGHYSLPHVAVRSPREKSRTAPKLAQAGILSAGSNRG